MTIRKVWLGSTGPFLFDDSILYIDEEGVIAPDNQQAIATNGQIVVQSPPTSDVHVVRKIELDNIATTLNLGTMAHQNANAVNITGGSAVLSNLLVNGPARINNYLGIGEAPDTVYNLRTGSAYFTSTILVAALIAALHSQFSATLSVLGGIGAKMEPDGSALCVRTYRNASTVLIVNRIPILDGLHIYSFVMRLVLR